MRAPKYIADFAFPQMGIGGGIRSAQERPRFARQSGTRIAYCLLGIGRDILSRQQSEGWGAKVVDRLAHDLLKAFPGVTGFGARNLKYMRAFAEAYPEQQFVQQVVAQLPRALTAFTALRSRQGRDVADGREILAISKLPINAPLQSSTGHRH